LVEALEVDARVDHLRLPAGLRHLRLKLAAEVVGDGDHGGGAADDEPRRCGHTRESPDVADVSPVRGDDERSTARECRDQAGGDEKVRVDHVRPEPARGAARATGELEVAPLSPGSAVEDGELELVPTSAERVLDLRDE